MVYVLDPSEFNDEAARHYSEQLAASELYLSAPRELTDILGNRWRWTMTEWVKENDGQGS